MNELGDSRVLDTRERRRFPVVSDSYVIALRFDAMGV